MQVDFIIQQQKERRIYCLTITYTYKMDLIFSLKVNLISFNELKIGQFRPKQQQQSLSLFYNK